MYALFALLVISYVSLCFLLFSLKNRRYSFIYLFIYCYIFQASGGKRASHSHARREGCDSRSALSSARLNNAKRKKRMFCSVTVHFSCFCGKYAETATKARQERNGENFTQLGALARREKLSLLKMVPGSNHELDRTSATEKREFGLTELYSDSTYNSKEHCTTRVYMSLYMNYFFYKVLFACQ